MRIRTGLSILLTSSCGVVVTSAFYVQLLGVLADEHGFTDDPTFTWMWLPFLLGVAIAVTSGVGLALLTTRRPSAKASTHTNA